MVRFYWCLDYVWRIGIDRFLRILYIDLGKLSICIKY